MDVVNVLCQIAQPGDCILDIGAHRGDVSGALAKSTQGTAPIYAFECHPQHYFHLAKRAGDCPSIHPFCKAMSDRIGHSTFYFGLEPQVDQASTLMPELANKDRLGEGFTSLRVETDTVDQFCQRQDLKPTFMKIDVEGAESLVFSGAKMIVEKHRPALVFEHGYSQRAPVAWYFNWLSQLGYQFFAIDLFVFAGPVVTGWKDVAPALLPIVPDDLQALHQETSCMMNVAAVQPERMNAYGLSLSEHSLAEFFRIMPTLKFHDPEPKLNGWRATVRQNLGRVKRALIRH